MSRYGRLFPDDPFVVFRWADSLVLKVVDAVSRSIQSALHINRAGVMLLALTPIFGVSFIWFTKVDHMLWELIVMCWLATMEIAYITEVAYMATIDVNLWPAYERNHHRLMREARPERVLILANVPMWLAVYPNGAGSWCALFFTVDSYLRGCSDIAPKDRLRFFKRREANAGAS